MTCVQPLAWRSDDYMGVDGDWQGIARWNSIDSERMFSIRVLSIVQ